ncbi:MAG: hypothetical protein JW959_00855 [Pirellulales bacterium]|nr:hypothetical protein [Pirellulales bacterium]
MAIRYICAAVAFFTLSIALVPPAEAAPPRGGKKKAAAVESVRDFRSQHFLIYTDLPPAEARSLLKDLENMLKLIAAYWGRQPRGIIECCVVDDLASWPDELIAKMEPEGLRKIKEGAGVCISAKMTKGKKFISKSRVYAVAEGGVPLHEAVHAYCHQTFGRAGPRWYAECMAEMGHYWEKDVIGVNVPENVIRYLKSSEPRPLESLIDNEEKLGGTWQDYCWWWMLGHMLDNNPNYFAQYRSFGRMILAGKEITFQDVFGPTAKELDFELRFFRQNLQNGYRVDLCSWDWKKKFTDRLPAGRAITVSVRADRGWQPSGLTVAADAAYDFETEGIWKVDKKGDSIDAGGADDGRGRLVGALLKDYQLGEEFELGKSGSFTARGDGDLYLRCRTPWNKVGDGSGKIDVRLEKK